MKLSATGYDLRIEMTRMGHVGSGLPPSVISEPGIALLVVSW